jgi:hypothetical protein
MVSCSLVVWWCWIFFVSWPCGICWALRFFWHWMWRIHFSELQYHIVCWIGTVIQTILLTPSSGQKMLATSFLETFVPLYKTMVCHIQEEVKQSHYRRGQALRVPGGWSFQISRQLAHDGGRVVSSMHLPPLPPRKYSWYSFLLEAVFRKTLHLVVLY